jgi:hypothetical protein
MGFIAISFSLECEWMRRLQIGLTAMPHTAVIQPSHCQTKLFQRYPGFPPPKQQHCFTPPTTPEIPTSVPLPLLRSRYGKLAYGIQRARRPHSSLGYQIPSEYACRRTKRLDGAARPQTPCRSPRQAFGELRINATKWQMSENQNIKKPAELQL